MFGFDKSEKYSAQNNVQEVGFYIDGHESDNLIAKWLEQRIVEISKLSEARKD